MTDRVAEQGGGDRLGFTLDQERFQRGGVERRSGALEDRGRHDDLARPRLLHQSGREVDRIAHHREGSARRTPEIADVHMAPVGAGAERQGRWPREEIVQREQQMVVVGIGRHRCAGGQDHLRTVGVRIARQQMHGMRSQHLAHVVGDRLTRLVQRLGTFGEVQVVGATLVDERDRHLPVLPIRVREHLLDQRGGEISIEPVDAAPGLERTEAHGADLGDPSTERPGAVGRRSAEPAVGNQAGRGRTEQDLPAIGRRFEVDRSRHRRPTHEQLEVATVDQREAEQTRMRPLRDAQSDVPHRVRRPALGDDRAHAFHRRHRPAGVVIVGEQHEQRVTTELDDVAAPLLARLDHLAEAAVQQIGQLLGSFVAQTRKTFGERREAADVRRHEGAVEDQQTVARTSALDVLDETRDIAGQDRAA